MVPRSTPSSTVPSQSLSRSSQTSSPLSRHSYSQPLVPTPSMSWKPISQLSTMHSPAAQSGKAPGSMQIAPQAPQFRGSVAVSKSSSINPSQSSSSSLHSSSPVAT